MVENRHEGRKENDRRKDLQSDEARLTFDEPSEKKICPLIYAAQQLLEGVAEKLEELSSRHGVKNQESEEKLQQKPPEDDPQGHLAPIGAHQPGKPHHHKQSKQADELLFHNSYLPCATGFSERESAPAAAASSSSERSASSLQARE